MDLNYLINYSLLITTNISVLLQSSKTDVKKSEIINAKPKEYLQSTKE